MHAAQKLPLLSNMTKSVAVLHIQILYIYLYYLHQLHQVKFLVSANLLGNKLVSGSDSDSDNRNNNVGLIPRGEHAVFGN